eukprot:3022691-Prymnesium_polylepis.1
MTVVLIAGASAQKEDFCASLAAKVGGSVLNMQQLMGAASQEPGAEGEELASLLQSGKLVPAPTQ